jgi:peptidoglycan/LPS O-acetylase OafA/YrhL
MTTKRISQLDGLRGVAILLVVVWHYYVGNRIGANHNATVLLAKRLLAFSWSGVDLFFVLSGFLIVGILLDQKDAKNYFHVFYLRRFCRILPVYYLLLALFWILSSTLTLTGTVHSALFANPLPAWIYLTLTQNLYMADRGFGPGWLGLTWSLCVEEQFYLLIPAVVRFFQVRTIAWIFAVCVLAAPVFRSLYPGLHAFVITPFRADALLSGGCLAILVRSPRVLALMFKHRSSLYLILVVLIAVNALFVDLESVGHSAHAWLAAVYSVLLLVSVVDSNGPMACFLSIPTLAWIGNRSYFIYLFHAPVLGLTSVVFGSTGMEITSIADLAVVTLALVMTLALSQVSFRYFEAYFLKLGQRVSYAPLGTSSRLDDVTHDR